MWEDAGQRPRISSGGTDCHPPAADLFGVGDMVAGGWSPGFHPGVRDVIRLRRIRSGMGMDMRGGGGWGPDSIRGYVGIIRLRGILSGRACNASESAAGG